MNDRLRQVRIGVLALQGAFAEHITILRRLGADVVEVLAELPDAVYVAVRQGPILATAFHPELTPDTRWHALFVEMARRA